MTQERQPIQRSGDLSPDEKARQVVQILTSNLADRQKRDSIYELIKEPPVEK